VAAAQSQSRIDVRKKVLRLRFRLRTDKNYPLQLILRNSVGARMALSVPEPECRLQ
jgi:hypothetical protein